MIERMIVQFSEASTFNCSLDAGSADFVATWGESFLPPEYEGPTEVTPDEAEHVLETRGMILGSDITVDAIPDDYVGSAITRRSQDDVTVSGPTVSAPSGYYEAPVSGTVQSGSVSVPNKSMTATPSIDVSTSGLITALVSSTKSIAPSVSEGYVTTGSSGTVTASGVSTTQLTTQAGTTITPTESEQTAVQAGRYTTGDVKVGAISSTYVGSDVPRHDSDDLSVSGATVTAPSGHYAAAASATVASGTEGTPSASKGTVSNHSVAVTPSVTNSEGYISGGTHAGTPVTVSASELVSGTYSVTSSGTKDVTNYKNASIPAGTEGTPTATKGTVSGHAVTVTPSVTNATGFITGSTKTGTGVSVSASELVSGTKSITSNGTNIDVTEYAAVDVAVPSGTPTLQTKTKSYTPTETAQSETVTYDAGYDGLDEVSISVGAISSTYVGSGIEQRDSTDLSASGATVTAPAGYYANTATKSVSSGTEGTPTATKGTVSSNRVTVTPSVTNSAGYISGGTHTGTGVTVQASELVSGTKTITGSGTTDVANYANASVAAGSATVPSTASGTGATASQSGTTLTLTKTLSITPTVSAGYVASGTAGNIALSISATDANFDAANIKSGVSIFGKTGTYTGGGGGSSNIAQGTFTTGSTRGSNSTVSVSYSGTGYPIACLVYVDGGPYNNSTGGNTTWYNSVNRYDCGYFSMVKSRTTEAPTYTTSGAENYGTCAIIYKNSTSQATSYAQASSRTINTFTSSTSNPNNSNGCIRFKGNGKTLAYYIGNSTSSTVGLAPSTKYAYIVIYSS